jgi:hypothetical protein
MTCVPRRSSPERRWVVFRLELAVNSIFPNTVSTDVRKMGASVLFIYLHREYIVNLNRIWSLARATPETYASFFIIRHNCIKTCPSLTFIMDRKNIKRGFKKLRVWPPAPLPAHRAYRPVGRAYAPEGKTPLPFMFWPVRYLPTFRWNWRE